MRNLEFWMRAFAGFAVCAFRISSAAASGQAPTAPASGTAPGKELYLKYSCYVCHGYDGHGGSGARLVALAIRSRC